MKTGGFSKFINKLIIMNAKLTLILNKDLVEDAKKYAKSRNLSLSKLVENHLRSLISKSEIRTKVSPLVESLTGIIPDEVNEREKYRDYLDQKYL